MRYCELGVNIDHVATLRQARGTDYPSPLEAALLAEKSGAEGITLHLREDRRHIQDADVYAMRDALTTRMNLEMAVTDEMLEIACKVKPFACCLVPEKRAELTTEGGLDVIANLASITAACERLQVVGTRTSLFVDPDPRQLDAAKATGAPVVELHTGSYADAHSEAQKAAELERIKTAAAYADSLGLIVHAGHGLNEDNVAEVAAIEQISELNIGHSIIAQAVMLGLAESVARMKSLIASARQ